MRHALKAQSIGCDAVSVDGFECGGHPGEDDIPNMILLPRAAQNYQIPFIASVVAGNGQQRLFDAEGVNMGTFYRNTRSACSSNVKDALVAASN